MDRQRKVTCTECGREFSPRGLAGHMRLKHGVQVPKAPLPSKGPDLAETLNAMVSALGRIEARLVELESGRPGGDHHARSGLTEELRGVLANIDHFREAPDGEDAIARAARFRRLGLLRRRQAELLYELGPPGSVTSDELLGT